MFWWEFYLFRMCLGAFLISAVRMMLLHPTDDPRTQGRLAEVLKVVFDGILFFYEVSGGFFDFSY